MSVQGKGLVIGGHAGGGGKQQRFRGDESVVAPNTVAASEAVNKV